jgi:hypothetical protein
MIFSLVISLGRKSNFGVRLKTKPGIPIDHASKPKCFEASAYAFHSGGFWKRYTSQNGLPTIRDGIMLEMSGHTGTLSGFPPDIAVIIRSFEVMLFHRVNYPTFHISNPDLDSTGLEPPKIGCRHPSDCLNTLEYRSFSPKPS